MDLNRHKRKLRARKHSQNSMFDIHCDYNNDFKCSAYYEEDDVYSIKECATQTSTTLLGKLESETESLTDITSDSIDSKEDPSTDRSPKIISYKTFKDNESLKLSSNLIYFNVDRKSTSQIDEKAKNYESNSSLIKMYQSKSNNLVSEENDQLLRSNFLLQTSPFKRLSNFSKIIDTNLKSKSCIETGVKTSSICDLDNTEIEDAKEPKMPSNSEIEISDIMSVRNNMSHKSDGDNQDTDSSLSASSYMSKLTNVQNVVKTDIDGINKTIKFEEDIRNNDYHPLSNMNASEFQGYTKKNYFADSITNMHFNNQSKFHNNRTRSFLSPTIASNQKNLLNKVQSLDNLMPTISRNYLSSIADNARYRVLYPQNYIREDFKPFVRKTLSKCPPRLNLTQDETCGGVPDRYMFDLPSTDTQEGSVASVINRIKDPDWSVALRGLADVVELCKTDFLNVYNHLPIAYQRVIQLIKCSRSYCNKMACQWCANIFEITKDTRRPEFDEIVNALLCKTADHNQSVRHQANLALDCMVTNVPFCHSFRALSTNGPYHKNPLVRFATLRLLICAIVLLTPSNLFSPTYNDYLRRRVFELMVKFILDKNQDIRRYGERLYRTLENEVGFSVCLHKFIERRQIIDVQKTLKVMSFTSF